MPSLAVVREQLKYIGASKFLISRGEVRKLPDILWDHEEIKKVIYGSYDSSLGLLLATDRRLLFVDKRFFHLKCDEIPYDHIMGVEFNIGLITGTLTVMHRGGELKIKGIRSRRARDFAEYLDVLICETKESAEPDSLTVPHSMPKSS